MGPDYDSYAAKMRAQTMDGIDLEVVARFADMLCPRNSRILDIGCGIGNTVNALRRCGHDAYGVDPPPPSSGCSKRPIRWKLVQTVISRPAELGYTQRAFAAGTVRRHINDRKCACLHFTWRTAKRIRFCRSGDPFKWSTHRWDHQQRPWRPHGPDRYSQRNLAAARTTICGLAFRPLRFRLSVVRECVCADCATVRVRDA